MTKLFKFLPLLFVAITGGLWISGCSDDDDEIISGDALPAQARAFIEQYYPSTTIVSAQRDRDDYDIVLSDGTAIDFDRLGEWKDVDAPAGKTVAKGFYPADIDIYVGLNYSGSGINEIAKDTRGYEVELVSGQELTFNHSGDFTGLDR